MQALHKPPTDSLDRTDQSDNVQMPISLRLNLADPLILQQLLDERRPFFPQHVGTGQRTVSSTDGEAVDPEMNEVLGGFESTFAGSDWGEANRTRVRS
jgi:hypothetical protein